MNTHTTVNVSGHFRMHHLRLLAWPIFAAASALVWLLQAQGNKKKRALQAGRAFLFGGKPICLAVSGRKVRRRVVR